MNSRRNRGIEVTSQYEKLIFDICGYQSSSISHYGRKGMKWYQHIFASKEQKERWKKEDELEDNRNKLRDLDSRGIRKKTVADYPEKTLHAGYKVYRADTEKGGTISKITYVSRNDDDRDTYLPWAYYNGKGKKGYEHTYEVTKPTKIASLETSRKEIGKLLQSKKYKDFGRELTARIIAIEDMYYSSDEVINAKGSKVIADVMKSNYDADILRSSTKYWNEKTHKEKTIDTEARLAMNKEFLNDLSKALTKKGYGGMYDNATMHVDMNYSHEGSESYILFNPPLKEKQVMEISKQMADDANTRSNRLAKDYSQLNRSTEAVRRLEEELGHSDSFDHHGVKGMKWYQHIFGDFEKGAAYAKKGITKAGSKAINAYKSGVNKVAEANQHRVQKRKEAKELRKKAAAEHKAIEKARKAPEQMTNEELKVATERLKLMNEYNRQYSQMYPDPKAARKAAGKELVQLLLKTGIEKGLPKAIDYIYEMNSPAVKNKAAENKGKILEEENKRDKALTSAREEKRIKTTKKIERLEAKSKRLNERRKSLETLIGKENVKGENYHYYIKKYEKKINKLNKQLNKIDNKINDKADFLEYKNEKLWKKQKKMAKRQRKLYKLANKK